MLTQLPETGRLQQGLSSLPRRPRRAIRYCLSCFSISVRASRPTAVFVPWRSEGPVVVLTGSVDHPSCKGQKAVPRSISRPFSPLSLSLAVSTFVHRGEVSADTTDARRRDLA